MGILMLPCPQTGKNFSTDITINKYTFIRDMEREAQCPYCNQIHKWRPHEARFVESQGPLDQKIHPVLPKRRWRGARITTWATALAMLSSSTSSAQTVRSPAPFVIVMAT
jgi:hypothetical protein